MQKTPDTAAGLRFIAGAAIAAIALGSALIELGRISDMQAKPVKKTGPKPQKRVSRGLTPLASAAKAGALLLHAKQEENEGIKSFMQKRYRGLYLLGRAGHQLNADEIDSFAREVGHFHAMCDRIEKNTEDQDLASWYVTVGVSSSVDFIQSLKAHPVIETEIKGAAAFMAYALRQHSGVGLTFAILPQDWQELQEMFGL